MTSVAATQSGGVWGPVSGIPVGSLGVLASPAGYTVAAPADFHSAAPPAVSGAVTNVFAGSKTIAADYFGLSFHRWPGSTTPPPDAAFKWARSHDYAPGNARVRWSSLETAQGGYNAANVAALDAFVSTHKAAGRTVIHTIYGTPDWASARPSEPSNYGNGIAAEPANLAHWDAHCTWLANRYGSQIDYWEVWNEPNLAGFYTGTQTILSQMVRRAAQAIRAVVPGAKIISPAVTALQSGNGQTYFAGMMAASDGAAGNMAAWVDAVGVHLYPTNSYGIASLPTMLAAFSASFAALGLSGKPIVNTEFGMLAPELQKFPAAERANIVARMMLLAAVCGGGCLASVWYDGDPDSSIGMKPEDWEAWNRIRSELTAGSVTVVNMLRDGRVAATVGGSNRIY